MDLRPRRRWRRASRSRLRPSRRPRRSRRRPPRRRSRLIRGRLRSRIPSRPARGGPSVPRPRRRHRRLLSVLSLDRSRQQPSRRPNLPRLARGIGERYLRAGRQRQRRFGHLVNHTARRPYKLVAIVCRSAGESHWIRTGAHRLPRWNRRSTSPSHRCRSSRNRRAPPGPRFRTLYS